MENKNKPAYPLSADFYNNEIGRGTNPSDYKGLTKRELFSMSLLQGILTHTSLPDDGTVKMAIYLADELLKQLDNEKA